VEHRQPDLAAIKERQQRAWASGDYAVFGATLLIMSELLCEAVDVRPGQEVLDVATGIDYVPALLDRGRERAAAERLPVAFREGDAESIPFPDASFDVVLSTVGVMFAPDQERTAGELLRVCRPGGRIGLANWTPDGFAGELGSLFGRYMPPSPGLKPPTLWGTEGRLRELFGDGAEHLRVVPRSFVFRYRSVRHYLEVLQNQLGPTRETFRTLGPAERESLAGGVADLVDRFNRSGDTTMVVPSDYLEVVVARR
jgi:SAM-dependent methyltransferase